MKRFDWPESPYNPFNLQQGVEDQGGSCPEIRTIPQGIIIDLLGTVALTPSQESNTATPSLQEVMGDVWWDRPNPQLSYQPPRDVWKYFPEAVHHAAANPSVDPAALLRFDEL